MYRWSMALVFSLTAGISSGGHSAELREGTSSKDLNLGTLTALLRQPEQQIDLAHAEVAIERMIDPLGLATVVIYSGATTSNPFGHIALATTGAGLFSYGTADPFGSSVTSYVDTQLMQRKVSIAVIPYTAPADEASMGWAMRAYSREKYGVITHNCSTAVGNALNAGGIPVSPTTAPGDMFDQISGLPGVQVFTLSPGGAPPDLSEFNQR